MESDAGRATSPASTRADEPSKELVAKEPVAKEPVASSEARWAERLEFLTSVLAACAIVLTAYSAYQATRWSGVEATHFATAGALRSQAAVLTTIAAAEIGYDANIFGELRIAFREADLDDPAVREEVTAFASTLLRAETRDAFREWLELQSAGNPDAPETPLEVPSYRNAELEQADQLVAQSEQRFEDARQANQHSDDYILVTILFASVLFFTGLRVKTNRIRALIEGFAALCLLGGIVRLLTLPLL